MLPPDGVVFVVDDDASVREGLQDYLAATGLRCEAFGSVAEFLRAARPDAPACLILDVHLPEGSALGLPADLLRAGAPIPTVFITGQATVPMSVRAMKTGAVEFLAKPFGGAELLAAIEQALLRDAAARAAIAEQWALRARFARLTPREREVLGHVVEGRLNKEIAARLGTAEITVKQQRGRVMRKLGVRSVPELVRLADRWHALPLPAQDVTGAGGGVPSAHG